MLPWSCPNSCVAAYWNESIDFADIFDVDYFIEKTKGFVHVVKELPEEIKLKDPFRVDCSKRKGQFDYVESLLPFLCIRLILEHFHSFSDLITKIIPHKSYGWETDARTLDGLPECSAFQFL